MTLSSPTSTKSKPGKTKATTHDAPVYRDIVVSGSRVNNLKEVSCRFPHRKLTVITGPSGSGKSSLAFDTLYAEGQRRFVESMSSYARQFLERIEKPDVDHIENILPAIALEQKNSVKNARSTVGTATEIYDYFRLMFANLGQTICPDCQVEVSRANPAHILSQLKAYPDGTKVYITAPVRLAEEPVTGLLEKGYFRYLDTNGEMAELTAQDAGLPKQTVLSMVIDRVILRAKDFETRGKSRLLESIQNALLLGQGILEVVPLEPSEDGQVSRKRFKNELACPECHAVFKEPTAHLFSFNSPIGACPSCEGFGRIAGLDMDKVIPNKSLTLAEGAVHPFTMPSNQDLFEALILECRRNGIREDVPYEALSTAEKRFVLEGKGKYEGIRKFFNWLETKKYKVHVRVMLAKYRGYYECPDCLGSRLRPEALNVQIQGKTILNLCSLPIDQLRQWFEDQTWSVAQLQRSERLLKEITNRIQYLESIGLGYLTLSRQTRTLSGGESQRINLSTALGSALTDTLYVLDEPTVGLHARDTDRLMKVLQALRDLENTIVVVEHDPEVILTADYVIDMGPGGGEEGGRVIFEGPVEALRQSAFSLTAQCLNQPPVVLKAPPLIAGFIEASGKPIEIKGARGNNLKNITVQLPKNQLVCITGVSGSGKSTLIKQTLFTSYQRDKGEDLWLELAPCDSITGLESFQDLVMVDQSPPGRSQRSNPVTYVKAYDEIRNLFAASRKAQVLGITPGHFSFNTSGGRCETCEGLGTVTIDMQFMADVTVVCEDCKGKRFNANVLSVDLFGRTIFDVLQMTVDEALKFFKTAAKVRSKLLPLQELGLGYLRLGQSTSTLSGGEAQRLKLVSYLSQSRREGPRTLFLFDEPTTGLHMHDIQRLVLVMRRLLEAGHSLIVIEHNLDFIAHADHVIDLGPEGGNKGGQLVYQGNLDGLMACKESVTGHYLQEFMAHRKQEALPEGDSTVESADEITPVKKPVKAPAKAKAKTSKKKA